MIQEALFVPETKGAMLPPEPPTPVVQAQPLGPCCKCGEIATLLSPGGSIYCAEHGKCGRKHVEMTALGINVRVCGRSVEMFVMHPRLGIWVCSCVLKFEREHATNP